VQGRVGRGFRVEKTSPLHGTAFAAQPVGLSMHATERAMTAELTSTEVLALLFPEPPVAGSPVKTVTAFVLDPHLGLQLQSIVPNRNLLQRVRVAARANEGTPIIDPYTREVIGYELAPLAVA
jgi:hypothetical protein